MEKKTGMHFILVYYIEMKIYGLPCLLNCHKNIHVRIIHYLCQESKLLPTDLFLNSLHYKYEATMILILLNYRIHKI